jgi:starch synthase
VYVTLNLMKVLFAVSEVAPIIKLGGLGDVAGSLPKALELLGVDVTVVVPFFPVAKTGNLSIYKSIELHVPFAGRIYDVEVHNTKIPNSNVKVVLLKNSYMFASGGKDAFGNSASETELFSFFDRAVVELIKAKLNTYDIIHCNDWHTGLITHLLQDELATTRPATLFTIHNLLYQGKGDLELVSDVGLVPGEHALLDWDTADNDVNLMLQGITSSDYVTTVSPAYAGEILTEEFGGGFSEILSARAGRIEGVLNGIDYDKFPRNYDVYNFVAQKSKIKEELQNKLKLESGTKPLFSFISRLDPNQKGLDILFDVIPEIVKGGGQFALLGTGDPVWEEKFSNLSEDAGVSVTIDFDVELAKLIYAGSDFLVVPSKYEPCGLIQMIAMWYGTLPIVHAVGGLRDSVENGVTGFWFEDYSASSLKSAVDTAFSVYKNQDSMRIMVKNAMKRDFSWDKSAYEYKKIYEKAIKLRRLAVELNT